MKKSILITATFLLWGWALVFAQEFPEKPQGFVNDYAGKLQPEEVQALEQIIYSIADSTSNQFAIGIFPDAQGYEYSDFAIKVAEKWKIGTEKKDNGVLIALFIKERGYAFQVGYGLEPVLTDAMTRQIFDQIMKPAFRSNQWFQGLKDAVIVSSQIASGEIKDPGQYGGNKDSTLKDIVGISLLLLILLVIVFSFVARRKGNPPGGGGGMGILPFLLLGGMGGRGGDHGSWGGGGSSGGGFSGFGGGSFGGGGSSGNW